MSAAVNDGTGCACVFASARCAVLSVLLQIGALGDSGGEPLVVTNQIKAEALHDINAYAASKSVFTVLARTCIQVCVKYERAHLHAFCFIYVLRLTIVTNLSINSPPPSHIRQFND